MSGSFPDSISAQELFDAAPDGLLLVARDGTILAANAGITAVLGYLPEDLISRNIEVLVPAGLRDRHREHLQAFAAAPGARGMGTGMDLHAVHASGQLVPVDIMLGPIRRADVVLAAVRDVSERRQREDSWVHRALHDPLTGLANRSLVLDRIGHALARAERAHGRIAVLFLDLDGFKSINDGLGHEAGDTVLATSGRRLSDATRPGDTVGRLGGDEFVVVIEEPGHAGQVAAYAERLRAAVSAPLAVAGAELAVGCSVGLALSDGHADAAALLAAADRRMYADKARRAHLTKGGDR